MVMARAIGCSIPELAAIANETPYLFDSLWWYTMNPNGAPEWKEQQETMKQARDRMKRERAEAQAKFWLVNGEK